MRFDSRNLLLLHPQIASRQHAAECPVIEHPVSHLRPAPRAPEFLRARRARVEHDKIVAQPRLRDDLCGPDFRGHGQFEVNLTRDIVYSERRKESEVMIDCVDEPDLRGNELVIAQLPERFATDGVVCDPPLCAREQGEKGRAIGP